MVMQCLSVFGGVGCGDAVLSVFGGVGCGDAVFECVWCCWVW